jgi:hypothetical protein
MPTPMLRWQVVIFIVGGLLAVAATAHAQANTDEARPFKPEELEQLAAPIALYPDSLLAQVFMASTYPLEVVQAERWAAANKNLKGDALAAELNKQDWDPSVKSLIDFPQVLEMMSKQLDWTTKLGDAFIADQAAIMAAVQRLRAKAKAEGNLKDTAEQRISVEQAPPPTVVVQGAPAPPPQIIVIESTSPDVVYVPTYNPTVIYGAWPYPAYPPYPPYYPPGYVAGSLISFGVGVACGAAWGHAWGHCDWGGGDVDIDVNRNANFNRNINRDDYRQNLQNRAGNRQGQGGQNRFQHDPGHRKGVSYRDQATSNRMNGPANMDVAKARDDFRGRAETGRQDIARGAADQFRGNTPNRGASPPRADAGRADTGRTGAANRPAASPANRPAASPSQRPATSQNRGSAFSGADRGGSAARADSNRGQMSRSSPSPSRSAPARSGGGGGGGARGGGGGARGGGGGGRR